MKAADDTMPSKLRSGPKSVDSCWLALMWTTPSRAFEKTAIVFCSSSVRCDCPALTHAPKRTNAVN